MKVRDKRDVEQALLKKGFRKADGDHHRFIFHDAAGMQTRVKTMTSHGSKGGTLDSYLLSQMARQCKLSKQDFEDLLDCPLSAEAYEKILSDAGSD